MCFDGIVEIDGGGVQLFGELLVDGRFFVVWRF